MLRKADSLLSDYRPEHSEFQIANFIVGGHAHPWAQYQQALRELAARRQGLIDSRERLNELKLRLEKFKRFGFIFGKKIKAITEKIANEKKEYKSRSREFAIFYNLARGLKLHIGKIDAAKRRQLESESWEAKAKRMAQIDYLVAGAISRQTVEFIEHFPRAMRRRLLIEVAEPVNLLGTVSHGEDRPAKK